MGGFCSSGTTEDGRDISNSIDAQIWKNRKNKEVKILLLGTGESGKSTITKQVKIIHLSGFSDEERLSTVGIIISNVFEGILTMIDLITKEDLLQTFSEETRSEFAYYLENVSPEVNLTNAVKDATLRIWEDPQVKAYLQRNAHKFKSSDSLRYYLDEFQRISSPDFEPTEKDVLLSRTKTTGINEIRFVENGIKYLFVDVGGQRSERKKWIYQFQDVSLVVFCVALSEYDQVLEEDILKNRLLEAASLFEENCNLKWFENSRIVLVFTKEDLFRDKITRVDLKECFPTYVGGKDFFRGLGFIKEYFNQLYYNPGKPLEIHSVTATDTESVRNLLYTLRNNALPSFPSSLSLRK